MAAIDQAEEIRKHLRAEIGARCLGEDFRFTLSCQAGATPQGNAIVWTFTIMMRSPLLGEGPLLFAVQVPVPQPPPEMIRELVTGALGQLRDLAGRQLAGANGAAR